MAKKAPSKEASKKPAAVQSQKAANQEVVQEFSKEERNKMIRAQILKYISTLRATKVSHI